mmetsp:Transcript_43209/g.97346  ORF Transcript_43209/g.97346 Transcript_43209/m.97346 type:complete len:225 (+) Transcript_43209:16-690(+)
MKSRAPPAPKAFSAVTCARGHALERMERLGLFHIHARYCDVCDRDLARKEPRWNCKACSYDVCEQCYWVKKQHALRVEAELQKRLASQQVQSDDDTPPHVGDFLSEPDIVSDPGPASPPPDSQHAAESRPAPRAPQPSAALPMAPARGGAETPPYVPLQPGFAQEDMAEQLLQGLRSKSLVPEPRAVVFDSGEGMWRQELDGLWHADGVPRKSQGDQFAHLFGT